MKPEKHYTRVQKGHSLALWIILNLAGLATVFLFPVTLIPVIYYSVSPNHFWHL